MVSLEDPHEPTQPRQRLKAIVSFSLSCILIDVQHM